MDSATHHHRGSGSLRRTCTVSGAQDCAAHETQQNEPGQDGGPRNYHNRSLFEPGYSRERTLQASHDDIPREGPGQSPQADPESCRAPIPESSTTAWQRVLPYELDDGAVGT